MGDVISVPGNASVYQVADRSAVSALFATPALVVALADLSLWTYHPSSVANDVTGCIVRPHASGQGAWLRADKTITVDMPVGFGTADNAVLFTTPLGAQLKVREAWWEVVTAFSGGVLSTVGLHSNVSPWTTKGDVLGGSLGDGAATLVATATRMVGTIGTRLTTLTNGRLLLQQGDTLNFGRIVSAFTTGSGTAKVLCDLLANPGQ